MLTTLEVAMSPPVCKETEPVDVLTLDWVCMPKSPLTCKVMLPAPSRTLKPSRTSVTLPSCLRNMSPVWLLTDSVLTTASSGLAALPTPCAMASCRSSARTWLMPDTGQAKVWPVILRADTSKRRVEAPEGGVRPKSWPSITKDGNDCPIVAEASDKLLTPVNETESEPPTTRPWLKLKLEPGPAWAPLKTSTGSPVSDFTPPRNSTSAASLMNN